MRDIIQARHVASHNVRRARTHIQLFLTETPKVSGLRSMVDRADHTSWLAFLNTVRTERFDQVLAIKALLPAIARAA
jgi:hypothetical protein